VGPDLFSDVDMIGKLARIAGCDEVCECGSLVLIRLPDASLDVRHAWASSAARAANVSLFAGISPAAVFTGRAEHRNRSSVDAGPLSAASARISRAGSGSATFPPTSRAVSSVATETPHSQQGSS
jgi:hypothetical protein